MGDLLPHLITFGAGAIAGALAVIGWFAWEASTWDD